MSHTHAYTRDVHTVIQTCTIELHWCNHQNACRLDFTCMPVKWWHAETLKCTSHFTLLNQRKHSNMINDELMKFITCSVLTCSLGKRLGCIQMWLLCLSKRQHSYSLTHKSGFFSFQTLNVPSFRTEPGVLFIPECVYEFMESPHVWDAALLSASDCSWSPEIKHKFYIIISYNDIIIFSKNISEWRHFFLTYLDQVGLWRGQSKSPPALMNLTQPLDSRPHLNYWKS